MDLITPIPITFFDGTPREFRSTRGAKKRAEEHCGFSLRLALTQKIETALPILVWSYMHDKDGNPPNFTLGWICENLPTSEDITVEYWSAIMSAITQGKKSKKAFEDQLRATMIDQPIGPQSSDSAPKSLESVPPIIGMDSSNVNSKPASLHTVPKKKPAIGPIESSSEPLQQPSSTL